MLYNKKIENFTRTLQNPLSVLPSLIVMLKSHYLKITFFLFLSLISLTNHANDNDTSLRPEAFTVHLDESIINTTGIQTLTLHTTQFSPEIETFATRVDLSPLIDTRKNYFSALARQESAHITLKQSKLNVQHLEILQREKAVSTRKFLAQKSQLEIDKANFMAAKQHADNILLHTQSKWGNVLSHWFLTEQYPYSNMLSTRAKPVYLIYLPAPVAHPMATILVHPFGLHEKAQAANLISSAPVYSKHQQVGIPFFYLGDKTFNAYHQRVVAWLPLQKDKQSGFIIPASSIVWHLGQAYAYLQVGDELFKRIKITQKKLASSESYFVQKPLQEGHILVSTGAQLLLSEEFRGQIPAEDDDDDD